MPNYATGTKLVVTLGGSIESSRGQYFDAGVEVEVVRQSFFGNKGFYVERLDGNGREVFVTSAEAMYMKPITDVVLVSEEEKEEEKDMMEELAIGTRLELLQNTPDGVMLGFKKGDIVEIKPNRHGVDDVDYAVVCVRSHEDNEDRTGYLRKTVVGKQARVIGVNPPNELAALTAEVKELRKELNDKLDAFIAKEERKERAKPAPMGYIEPKPLSRAEVVRMAKRDVEHLESLIGNGENASEGNHIFRNLMTRVEFNVNPEKRTVVAIVKGARYGNYVLGRGFAKAMPEDVFNAHIGKAIAMRRAYGLHVPIEYTDAPKPKGRAEGMVVRGGNGERYLIVGESDLIGSHNNHLNMPACQLGSMYSERTVLEDTEVDYEG